MSDSRRTAWLLTALLLPASPAWGQCEVARLLPSDGNADDRFGQAVALGNQVAAVGAWRDDELGANSGSVYIFRYDGLDWIEEVRLEASDGQADTRFGNAVAMSGAALLVGAPGDDGSGSAYVLRDTGGTWVEEAKLRPDDGAPGDSFGISVSISGDIAVVGASRHDDGGVNTGAAYVFRFQAGDWTQEAKLVPAVQGSGDEFARSVAIDGTVIVVGALFADALGPDSGSASIFRFNPGPQAWEETVILPSDGAAFDWFGLSVSISGDAVLVGAQRALGVAPLTGAGYVFRFDGATWIEETKLLASDGGSGDRLGRDTALFGDIALIGANAADDNCVDSGSVYFFQVSDPVASEVKRLAADGTSDDRYGLSLDLDGSFALVGAFFDDPSGPESGSAYVLDYAAIDCNDNGICDAREIAIALGADCNGNGVPDDCDIAAGTSLDCDGNLVPDACDPDCDGDGTPDGCAIVAGAPDCDGNGVPDACEITTHDCNDNGILDACEAALGTSDDCNLNGVPDQCDFFAGTAEDCDANGILDECETTLPFAFDSGVVLFVGCETPQRFDIIDPPTAVSDVAMTFTVQGDFETDENYLEVVLNGQSLGRIFEHDGTTCADPGDETTVVVPGPMYNQLASAGVVSIVLLAAPGVHPLQCGGQSWARVRVEYTGATGEPPAACACPGDLDGSGGVDFGDLLIILLSQGPCPARAPCPGDLSGDGLVGFGDMVLLLLAWGACP